MGQQPTPKRKRKLNIGAEKAVRLEDLTTPAATDTIERASEHEYDVNDNEDYPSNEESVSSDDDETSVLGHPPTAAGLKEGMFVTVKFLYNQGTKKECLKTFVAKIVKLQKKSCRVSCLRAYNGSLYV